MRSEEDAKPSAAACRKTPGRGSGTARGRRLGIKSFRPTPERTQALVAAVAKRRDGRRSKASHALAQLRGQLGHVNDRIRNLLNALTEGLAHDSEMFKETLASAEAERAELQRLIEAQERQTKEALQPITIDQARIASSKLKDLIREAPADLKKRYIRALVSEIVVGKSQIVISGPKDALAEAVSGEPPAHLAAAAGPVRSLVQEWRAGAGETENWAASRKRERKAA